MSARQLSRRGLLGMVAAAPVAAIAKPLIGSPVFTGVELGGSYMSVGALTGWRACPADVEWITIEVPEIEFCGSGGAGGGYTTFKLATAEHPERWPDGEGPGAPVEASGVGAVLIPTGAPAPDRATKSDAVAGIEDRNSPSGPFLATAAASGADDRVNEFMKLARAM